MKKSTRSNLTSRVLPPTWQNLCTITFSLLAATPAAQAASATWSATPTDALWSTAGNWNASPVPGIGDTATFSGASTQTTINTGTISLSQVLLNSTTAYTFGTSAGTGSITFADGTTTALNITNPGPGNTTANITINANIILGTAVTSNTTFTSGVNKTTTLAGSITGGTGGTAAAKILTLAPTSNSSSVVTVSGAISDGGASSLALSKGGIGTVNLTNANNSFTGGLTVTSGTVNVSSLGALGSATTGLITLGFGSQSPGTLNFSGSPGSLSRQVQIGSSGSGGTGGATINNNATNGSTPLIFTNTNFNAQISNTGSSPRILTLGGANTDANEIQGTIRNNTGSGAAIAVTKADGGTWTLSGDNSYTGPTNVNGGKLVLNGSISTSSLTTVASGATLGGTGTVGQTVINGTLAVGNSAGKMDFTNTLGLNGTTIMEIDGTSGAGVIGGNDLVNLTGTGVAGVLTYGGALTLDMGVIFAAGTYSWNLFDMASETGTFTTIALADKYSGSLVGSSGVWDLTSGDNTWKFTETTGVLGLTVVPEPNAALLGGLGLLALLRRRRI